jgi:hypothetical protein
LRASNNGNNFVTRILKIKQVLSFLFKYKELKGTKLKKSVDTSCLKFSVPWK